MARALVLLAVWVVGGAACSEAPIPDDDGAPGSTQQGIVGGTADTTHPAVVSLLLTSASSGAGCSGTIVRVSGTTGTILTSAHCFQIDPTSISIRLGPNSASPAASFNATSWSLYPTTSGALFDDDHDLAVVLFEGASGTTPVMPIVPPAGYAAFGASAPFVIVGYGVTQADGGQNAQRNKLSVTLQRFFGNKVETTSAVGSSCFGDSGGAVVDSSTGSDRLAAVTASGTSCSANATNTGIGFYPPEIAAWLRSKAIVAPDAPLPVGADCVTDASCANGSCYPVNVSSPSGTVVRNMCTRVTNGFFCQRASHCLSRFCNGGGCQACTNATHCGGAACVVGVCQAGGASDAGSTTDAGPPSDGGGSPGDASTKADAATPKRDGSAGGNDPDAEPEPTGKEEPGDPATVPPAASAVPHSNAAPAADEGGCAAAPRGRGEGRDSRGAGALLLTLALAAARRRSRR